MLMLGSLGVVLYVMGVSFDEYRRRGRSTNLDEVQSLFLATMFGALGFFGLTRAVSAKLQNKAVAAAVDKVGKIVMGAGGILFLGSLFFDFDA